MACGPGDFREPWDHETAANEAPRAKPLQILQCRNVMGEGVGARTVPSRRLAEDEVLPRVRIEIRHRNANSTNASLGIRAASACRMPPVSSQIRPIQGFHQRPMCFCARPVGGKTIASVMKKVAATRNNRSRPGPSPQLNQPSGWR
jgi:hypothetical protein